MADTTTTTLSLAIPTIVAAAMLELVEGDIVRPLVTNISFPGPGVIHQSPFIQKLTSEADDSLASQALNASNSDEQLSSATVGVHGAYVMLKDIANLGAVSDMAAIAGTLIGQCVVKRRDTDLVTLFSSFTTDQGAFASTLAPADLYDAYGSLRTAFAPLPYHLVLYPTQIWSSAGLISLFDNSSDAIQTMGPGTIGEDWAKYGFAGMSLGFNLWSDANITMATNSGTGAAFSSAAIKFVSKRGFMAEIARDPAEVGNRITGNEIWGEAIMRNKHGNKMTFHL